MKSSYSELKQQAFEANMEIPRRRLAIYTFGNVSAFDAERAVFAIKPSGVAYESLTAADMVVLDIDANIVEGTCGLPRTRRPTPPFTAPSPSRGSAGSFTRTRPTRRPGRRPACRFRSTARPTRITWRRTSRARS
jgi:Class II Aldolase and Adducin N-terminal domain